MPDSSTPPKSFWIIASLALVWNLMGVAAYLAQVKMGDAALAAMPEAQRALHEATPAWLTGTYALAVHSGALASLLLLLRKAWAVPVFAISLACILVQMGYSILATEAVTVFGPSALVMPLFVIAAGIFLLRYSRSAKSRGYLS